MESDLNAKEIKISFKYQFRLLPFWLKNVSLVFYKEEFPLKIVTDIILVKHFKYAQEHFACSVGKMVDSSWIIEE